MAYFLVDDFGGGVDTRRSVVSAPGRTMRRIENAFVNKGGEIEGRAPWALQGTISNFLHSTHRRACLGPVPGMDRSAILFLAPTSLSGGSNIAEGNGSYYLFDDVKIGTSQISFSANDGIRTNSWLRVADKYISSHTVGITPGGPFFAGTNQHAVMAGEDVFASTTNIGNGNYISTTANVTIGLRARFNSTFYLAPNQWRFGKSDNTDPANFYAGTGSGAADLRGQGEPIGRPRALIEYFGQLAIFGDDGIQFWDVDADFANVGYQRTISGPSLAGYRSVLQYGDNDVLYLTANGSRSLRARDSSNFATTTDIGSPIDEDIIDELDMNGLFGDFACCVVHEGLGQAWFFVGDKAYVLSRYTSANVLAWSTFTLPPSYNNYVSYQIASGVDLNDWVHDACRLKDTVAIRTGSDCVYIYDGTDQPAADQSFAPPADDNIAIVESPFFDFGDPAMEKVFSAIDVACEGAWTVQAAYDPANIQWTTIASLNGNTHQVGQVAFDATATHVALRFVSSGARPHKLTHFGIHYTEGERS